MRVCVFVREMKLKVECSIVSSENGPYSSNKQLKIGLEFIDPFLAIEQEGKQQQMKKCKRHFEKCDVFLFVSLSTFRNKNPATRNT